MSKVIVNGNYQDVDNSISISELIKLNKVVDAAMVSVQLNRKFVDRKDFDTTVLNDGDEIDFLYFMGGGQGN